MKRIILLFLVFTGVFFALAGCSHRTQIQLHAIPLANDDGTNAPDLAFTAPAMDSLVIDLNVIFAQADIEFLFDPASDWEPMQNTKLNHLTNTASNYWLLPNAVAAKYPNKLVVFFRFGGDTTIPSPALRQPTGNGFGNVPDIGQPFPPGWNRPAENIHFVAMPNQWNLITQGATLGNGTIGSFFAHELGHHLGLFHTFPGRSTEYVYGTLPNRAAAPAVFDFTAEAKLVEYLRNGGSLEGDFMSDTPPDPGPPIYTATLGGSCVGVDPATGADSNLPLTILGVQADAPYQYSFQADRTNIMGYTSRCSQVHTFSPLQRERMHETLRHPNRLYLVQ